MQEVYQKYQRKVDNLRIEIMGVIIDKIKELGGNLNVAKYTEDDNYNAYNYTFSNFNIGGDGNDDDLYRLENLNIKENGGLYCEFYCDWGDYLVETEIIGLDIDAMLYVLDIVEEIEKEIAEDR